MVPAAPFVGPSLGVEFGSTNLEKCREGVTRSLLKDAALPLLIAHGALQRFYRLADRTGRQFFPLHLRASFEASLLQ